LSTPLPGVVVGLSVTEGEAVKAGQTLLVIEAMKMEHSIRAPHDGVVKQIHYQVGARVRENSTLIELGAPDTTAKAK
jgi:3-methylcrotonyl-CoA carboxylase alpha subunit